MIIKHSCPTIEADDIKAVRRTLASKQIASGRMSFLFSEKLKNFFQAKKVFLTPSGKEAIRLALGALKIGKNDEVIIPAYVCESVVWAVKAAGAKLVAADINLDDYNINYEDAVKKISARTKAIIAPHLFGNPVKDIGRFLKLKVPVIEDAAQAIGGVYLGRKLGKFADITVCSFYATKVITTGDGGALIFNANGHDNTAGSGNYFYQMPDLQAALGLSQLQKINKFIKRRADIFNLYRRGLKKISGVRLADPAASIHYRCLIETENQAATVVKKLNVYGIKAERYTDVAFNCLRLNSRDYPNTRHAIDKVVSLPIYPSLQIKEIKYIIARLRKAMLI